MYLIIEKYGGLEYASIVTTEEGEVDLMLTVSGAQDVAEDCQDGVILDFEKNLILTRETDYKAPSPLPLNHLSSIQLRGKRSNSLPYLEAFIALPNRESHILIRGDSFDLFKWFNAESTANMLVRFKEVLTALNVDLSNFDSLLPKELK